MRSVVLGAGGLVGRSLAAELASRSGPVLAASKADVDITNRESVARCLREFAPDVVFNCAAYTRVDDCESRQELAYRVNGDGVANVVSAAQRVDARLVHLSTDYVFDGKSSTPYEECAPPAPLSIYGESKLVGETATLAAPDGLVVRSSWIFGSTGPSFVQTVVGLLAGGDPLRVVDDQLGCPTYAPFLAAALVDLAAARVRGIVHYRNREPVTWCGFARAIVERVEPGRSIVPISTHEAARPASRPPLSVLAVDRFEEVLSRKVEEWAPGLDDCLGKLGFSARRSACVP